MFRQGKSGIQDESEQEEKIVILWSPSTNCQEHFPAVPLSILTKRCAHCKGLINLIKWQRYILLFVLCGFPSLVPSHKVSVPKENSGLKVSEAGHVYIVDKVESVQIFVPFPEETNWGEAPVLQMIRDIRNSWIKGSWNCDEQEEGEKAGEIGPRFISLMGTHKLIANSSLYLVEKVNKEVTALKWKHGNLSELVSEFTRMRRLARIRDRRDAPILQHEPEFESQIHGRYSGCVYPQKCDVALLEPGTGIDALIDSISTTVLNEYGLTAVINDGLALVQSLRKQKSSGTNRKTLISSLTRDMERIVNNTEKPRNCHEIMYVRDQLNYITPQVHTMLSALLNDIRQESMELETFAGKIQSSLLSITKGLIPPALVPLESVWHLTQSISAATGNTFSFSENLALIYEFRCLTSVMANEKGILFNIDMPYTTSYASLSLFDVEFMPMRIPKHFTCLGLELPSTSLMYLNNKYWEFEDQDCSSIGYSSLACIWTILDTS